jgi:hypothetical protein
LTLVVFLVCGNNSIVIVIWLTSSSVLSCASHLINVVVVAVATPPALKVYCYFFHGIGAGRPLAAAIAVITVSSTSEFC